MPGHIIFFILKKNSYDANDSFIPGCLDWICDVRIQYEQKP
jgi:hypothetical protein